MFKTNNDKINSKSVLTLPKLKHLNYETVWIVKAHFEIIKSLEFVPMESILITTSFDKRVKIWDCLEGKLIDSFQ